MSNFLAIDTSSKYLSVVAKNGEKVVREFVPDCALNHSVMLMPTVDKVLNSANLDTKDCDFFVAVTGPGSFTGIRIGISAVKGFAVATNKKMLGVTSFDLIAYNVFSDQDFLVAIDAAHGHYYVCGYSKDKNVILQPCYLSKEETEEKALPVYGFEQLDLKGYKAIDISDCLYNAVLAKEAELGDDVEALYVRKSQAEEGRK